VATQVGGNSEILADGTYGVLVPAKDPHALVTAVLSILRDKQLAQTLGRKVQEHAFNDLSHKSMVRKYEEVYERVINSA